MRFNVEMVQARPRRCCEKELHGEILCDHWKVVTDLFLMCHFAVVVVVVVWFVIGPVLLGSFGPCWFFSVLLRIALLVSVVRFSVLPRGCSALFRSVLLCFELFLFCARERTVPFNLVELRVQDCWTAVANNAESACVCYCSAHCRSAWRRVAAWRAIYVLQSTLQ